MTTLRERIQELMLAILLAFGFCAVWTVGFNYVCRKESRSEFVELEFLCDGTPIFGDIDANGKRKFHTLDGKSVENIEYGDFAWNAWLGNAIPCKESFVRVPWESRIMTFAGPRRYPTVWYFVHDGQKNGRGYFVGFDKKKRVRVGAIGPHGFYSGMETPPLKEQYPIRGDRVSWYSGALWLNHNFSGSVDDEPDHTDGRPYRSWEDFWNPALAWCVLFRADDGLMRVNVKEGTTICLRKEGDIVSARLAISEGTTEVKAVPSAILIREPDRVVLTDVDGRETRSYPLPRELREIPFCWIPLSNGEVLIHATEERKVEGPWDSSDQPSVVKRQTKRYWLDATGTIVRTQEITLPSPEKRSVPIDRVTLAFETLSPIVTLGKIADFPHRFEDLPYSFDHSVAVRQMLIAWPGVLAEVLLSIFLACLCAWRQWRYRQAGTWMWVGFVLLFGLPAYIGYRFHRKWPPRVACPCCGRRVPHDRPMCCDCSGAFPAPAAKGTEVFA